MFIKCVLHAWQGLFYSFLATLLIPILQMKKVT